MHESMCLILTHVSGLGHGVQLQCGEPDRLGRRLAFRPVQIVHGHAPFASARDACDAPGVAAAWQRRARARASREATRSFIIMSSTGTRYLVPTSW